MSECKEGELPPVGTECIVETDFHKVKAFIKLYDGDSVVYRPYIGSLYAEKISDCTFLPLKTDEEKAIEDMLAIVQSHYRETASSIPDETMNDENWKSYLAALYENGYRKT